MKHAFGAARPCAKSIKAGFTLIELLVVVLIIGILAAVALPQYERSVTKARFAEAFTTLKSMADAVKICEMSNGADSENCKFIDNLNLGPSDPMASNCLKTTDNFWYCTDKGAFNSPDVLALARYNKAEVCMCIYRNGRFTVGKNHMACANGKEFNFDLDKLLNVENDSHCACC